jgi:small subunit ribosomal protein S4
MKRVKEKKERSLNAKLFLKADRCNSPKCVMVRRPYRPGPHGQKRHTVSEYGKQLQEKQKVQLMYGLTNRQMTNLFNKYSNKDDIVKMLEHRLDRVVFLLGLAGSSRIARQMISHGHITVNDRKVTVPSFHVSVKDAVSIRPESMRLKVFVGIGESLKKNPTPPWLKITNAEQAKGECVSEFDIRDIQFPFDINLVGEFYAR